MTYQDTYPKDVSARTNPMEYLEGMEQISSDLMDQVLSQRNGYEADSYTEKQVLSALTHETCDVEDFKAYLSPAAQPYLAQMCEKADRETRKYFGNNISIFTPIYISNYCENHCVYCGFHCNNDIHRKKLDFMEIELEMKEIAATGQEEILILTGESRTMSDMKYIGEACKLGRKYFKNVGLEVYPMNSEEYHYLNQCGADYVTVFQETYNPVKYETLHLKGHKRVFPYRFYAQERALLGGMRGVSFSALLGLDDFRKDALATGYHAYLIQRKYPHAEISLSCPRLRPSIHNDNIASMNVSEKQLCQILCAYRLFLPFACITVSSRENARFRNGIIKIAATKLSAGVSTAVGDHEAASPGKASPDKGDAQFEIADPRSFDEICQAIRRQGLQPVSNDYLYV